MPTIMVFGPGIGFEIANHFAREGFDIVLASSDLPS